MKFINDIHDMQKHYYEHHQSQYPGYFPYTNGYGYSTAESSHHQMGYSNGAPTAGGGGSAGIAHHPSATGPGITEAAYRAQCLMQTPGSMPSSGQGMTPPMDGYPQPYLPPTSSCMQTALPPGCGVAGGVGGVAGGLGGVMPTAPGGLHPQSTQGGGKSPQEIYPRMRESRQNTSKHRSGSTNSSANHHAIVTGNKILNL